jgi:hypothetical protein
MPSSRACDLADFAPPPPGPAGEGLARGQRAGTRTLPAGAQALYSGVMADLPGSVADLVRAATTDAEPRQLRATVEKVLGAFPGASAQARDGAVSAIARALSKAQGAGAQVLALALGALVEAGASAELAWPAISRDLVRLLDNATAFAAAALQKSKELDVDVAIEKAVDLAKKQPAEAMAWRSLPSRCLAAIPCLTHSKAVRAKARTEDALLAAAWPLSDAIPEVGYFLQALRIVDDETLLVLAPAAGRGWRVAIDSIPSNAELYVLLADALARDPAAQRVVGKRPDAKVLTAIREGTAPKRPLPAVALRFELLAWTAVGADGSVASDPSEHRIDADGLPAEIPPLGNERVVLLQEASDTRPITIPPPFEGLHPTLEVTSELSSSDVVRAMVKIATVVADATSKAQRRSQTSKKTSKKASKTTQTKKKRSRAK